MTARHQMIKDMKELGYSRWEILQVFPNKTFKRFMGFVDRNGEHVEGAPGPCWRWKGGTNPAGYGWFYLTGGRNARCVMAHRYIFQCYNGSIDKNLTIDHLCANKLCVNPEHLEQVPREENYKRGSKPHFERK